MLTNWLLQVCCCFLKQDPTTIWQHAPLQTTCRHVTIKVHQLSRCHWHHCPLPLPEEKNKFLNAKWAKNTHTFKHTQWHNTVRPLPTTGRRRSCASADVKPKYSHKLPLPSVKITDLKALCETVIPASHHTFYQSLFE